jgi:16S rRNA (guanine1516-N2)-methyltransferase
MNSHDKGLVQRDPCHGSIRHRQSDRKSFTVRSVRVATIAGQVEVTFAPPHRALDLDLCARFGIAPASDVDEAAWQLRRSHDGELELRGPVSSTGEPLCIRLDPRHGTLAHRLKTSGRKDALARAIGLHRRRDLAVVDATAGLGRDAMVLASLGAQVTAVERVPALALLLYSATHGVLPFELEVIPADARTWLRTPPVRPVDVVYLDPMFGETGSAQVKKEMQACRALASGDDSDDLFAAARAAATDRVVVKRHRGAPPIAPTPSFSVGGERVRFDVYLAARA